MGAFTAKPKAPKPSSQVVYYVPRDSKTTGSSSSRTPHTTPPRHHFSGYCHAHKSSMSCLIDIYIFLFYIHLSPTLDISRHFINAINQGEAEHKKSQ